MYQIHIKSKLIYRSHIFVDFIDFLTKNLFSSIFLVIFIHNFIYMIQYVIFFNLSLGFFQLFIQFSLDLDLLDHHIILS